MEYADLFLEIHMPITFLIFLAGSWGLLIFHLSREWWINPQYGYGFLVPIFCGWILWNRRSEIAEAFNQVTPPQRSRWIHAFFYLGAAGLFLLELLRQVSPLLRHIGMMGVCLCVGFTFCLLKQLGLRRLPSVLKGSILLFFTAIPWPTSLETSLVQLLKTEIAGMTSEILNLIGILAIQRGNLIELSQGIVSIEEACSGLRSLQSCIMIGVALGQFFCLSWYRAVALMVLSVFLALLGNLIRTTTLTVIAAWKGPSSIETFHDPAGLVILVGVTFVLYFVAKRWGHLCLSPHEVKFPSIHWNRLPSLKGVIAVGILSLVAAHLWYWYRSTSELSKNEPFLEVNHSSPLKVNEISVPPDILNVLRPHQGAYYRGFSPSFGEIAIYTFFWLPDSDQRIAFFHRPDVCMKGAGWKPVGDVDQIKINLNDQETIWYVFHFQQENQKVIQAWGVWRNGVEQQLSFSRGWKSFLGQQLQLWHYVWQGQIKANTQILSVILDAHLADQEALREVIQQLFRARK